MSSADLLVTVAFLAWLVVVGAGVTKAYERWVLWRRRRFIRRLQQEADRDYRDWAKDFR